LDTRSRLQAGVDYEIAYHFARENKKDMLILQKAEVGIEPWNCQYKVDSSS
jgi:hypothetical protein